ncbi:MAG: glycosyltransferase family 4 protein [Phycisphaerae bacterium]|nr:glycosyltransferase family 4 protein [Phycisphaerae bacterium]MDW8261176.1 glycosyltransferase family 4 protein [Phycisphaerales bacterium]
MSLPTLRALHLYSGNLYGGVERFLATLAELKPLCPGIEHRFALCFEGRLADQLRAAGGAVRMLGPVRFSRPWTVWAARRRLAALLREDPPDVAITHSGWLHRLFAPVTSQARIPTVFLAHNCWEPARAENRSLLALPPVAILANSRFTAESFRAAGHWKQVAWTYLPAPTSGSNRRQQLRREAQVGEQECVILCACRLERWKGQMLLLQALSELRAPGWRCWIAGGAQRPSERAYQRQLLERVNRLGLSDRVTFLGHRDDMADLWSAADVHCQPNTAPEAFGLAFIEAMRAGLPVVTTRLGSAVELLEGSRAGILVPPDDAKALAEALRQLVENPDLRQQMGLSARERASEIADPAARLADLEELLRRAVGESVLRP